MKNSQERWDCMLNAVQGADLGTVSAGAVQSLLLLLIVRMNIYTKEFYIFLG